MNLAHILLFVAGGAFAITFLLWQIGADRTLSYIGRWMIRILTRNRVQMPHNRFAEDAGAAALLFFFLLLLLFLLLG